MATVDNRILEAHAGEDGNDFAGDHVSSTAALVFEYYRFPRNYCRQAWATDSSVATMLPAYGATSQAQQPL